MSIESWEFLNEVNVVTPWQSEWGKALSSTKWQDRKESLEALIAGMKKNPKIDSSVPYDEVVLSLKKILTSDSNINVVQVALEAISCLARGLRSAFAPHVGKLIGSVLDKSKEKKQNVRDAVSLALDALADATTPERIESAIMEHIGKPSPLSKLAILEFLYRYFVIMVVTPLPFLKNILPIIVKLTGDADVKVREASCLCLGSAKRLLGDSIVVFLQNIASDAGKMDKIDCAFVKSKEEHAALKKDDIATLSVGGDNERAENDDPSVATESISGFIDPWTLQDPVDLVPRLPTNFNDLLASKKWQERKEAVDVLEGLLKNKPRLQCVASLLDVSEAVLKVMEKDVNINVASGSALCLAGIIYGLRDEFPQKYCGKAATVAFEKMKDKKEILRKELNGLVDTISLTFHIDVYSDSILSGMNNKNPQCRSQTCIFLKRLLANMDSQTLPVQAIKNFKDSISKCSTDADAEVRDAALFCVSAICKSVGEQVVGAIFSDIMEDKLRSEKIKSNVDKLKEEFGITASPELRRIYKKDPALQKSVPKPPVQVKTATKPIKPITNRPSTASSRTPIVSHRLPLSSRSDVCSVRPNVVVSAPPAAKAISVRPLPPKVTVPRHVSSTNATQQPKIVKQTGSSTPRVVRNDIRAAPPRGPVLVPNVVRRTTAMKSQVSETVTVPSVRPFPSRPRPDSARFGFRPASKQSSRAGSKASSPVR